MVINNEPNLGRLSKHEFETEQLCGQSYKRKEKQKLHLPQLNKLNRGAIIVLLGN